MGLIESLLGCPLQNITRSYWAVRLNTGEWMSEARLKVDITNGSCLFPGPERFYDWSNDLVANGDIMHVSEIWLLCPPSQTSPLGNTARLKITEPGTVFQLKIATVDSNIAASSRSMQAHIIGRVDNKETGDCSCYIWDYAQDGLCTPETPIYNPLTGGLMRDRDGNLLYAGKTNVYNFHSWRPGSIAPPGRLELDTLGVNLS